jgi:hypothetical protein
MRLKYEGTKIGFGVAFSFILVLFLTLAFAQTSATTESGERVILFPDGTYRSAIEPKPDGSLVLRIKQIGSERSASKEDIEEAHSLATAGWRYVLPQPKSAQAAWGNYDGRTTWWYGYWENIKTNEYSSAIPKLGQSGVWVGDGQNRRGYYRRGGSPAYPTKVELILSDLR